MSEWRKKNPSFIINTAWFGNPDANSHDCNKSVYGNKMIILALNYVYLLL